MEVHLDEWMIHPSAPIYTETKVLNLTNIMTLNNCMFVFDNLNSSLPAIFDDLFKISQKWEPYFMVPHQFRLAKSIKDWNDTAS